MTHARRLLLSLALTLAACGDRSVAPEEPVTVATVRVRASAPAVSPGDTLTLSAELLDAKGRPVAGLPVAWQWADSTVLQGTVEGNVLRVHGTRPVVVQVTAQSGAVRGTFEVTVRHPEPTGVRFRLAPPDSLVVGAQPQVVAAAVDSLGRVVPDRIPVVTSSDTSVAVVRATSVGPRLEARRSGTTEVAATLGALRTSVRVRVWPAPRYVFPDTSVLLPGLARTLRAQERPVDAQAFPIAADAWISSAPGVASVNAAGLVTAVGAGRATISAVVGRDTLSALVVVKPPSAVEYVALVPGAPCAIARDGGIYCWGPGNLLGTTEVVDRCEAFQWFSGAGTSWYDRSVGRCSALPVRVQSASRFVSASGNGAGVCALTDDGTVECWGQVPTPAGTSPVPVPMPLPPGLRVTAVDGLCLHTTEGVPHCWGAWSAPIFENGAKSSPTPQRVPSPVPFRQVGIGAGHLCGVTPDDVAYCWGSNSSGQLGTAGSTQAAGCSTACEPRPQPVVGLPRTRLIQPSGFASTCALDLQDVVRCWGQRYAAGGRGVQSPTPVVVPGAPPLATLTSGRGESCGLTATGELWCWGSQFHRPDGTIVSSVERAERAGPTFPLRAATVTSGYGCGIGTDAVLHCWGTGLLGDGVWPAPTTGTWRIGRVAGQR